MPPLKTSSPLQRVFGLRIAENVIQLAVASPDSDGIYDLQIDEVACTAPHGWFTAEGTAALQEALHQLSARWEMRRKQVAVSIDGDFCVTRIAMGARHRVDEEIETLHSRVQRYLSLGPGEKIVGHSRESLTAGTDYAVTAVVNRVVIEAIYEAFRRENLDVMWAEPSLVSIARLLHRVQASDDQPILVADGSGGQWDIGIAHQGRLLLDYRPAAARSADGLREALLGHVERLRRFCDRHREVAAGDLKRLLICGSTHTVAGAVIAFAGQSEIEVAVFSAPEIPDLYRIDANSLLVDHTAAVAAVLPLMESPPEGSIPDMLVEVRRDSDLTFTAKMLRLTAPLLVAAAILLPMFTMVASEQDKLEHLHAITIDLDQQLVAARQSIQTLAAKRTLVNHLQRIEQQTLEADWNDLFVRITGCFPPEAKLNELRWQSGQDIVLDGTITEESLVFDMISYLRQLPEVREVALQGTSNEGLDRQIQFQIRLSTQPAKSDSSVKETPHA